MCKCEKRYSPNGTCQKAYKWLFQKYKKADLPWLKLTYEKLINDALKYSFD